MNRIILLIGVIMISSISNAHKYDSLGTSLESLPLNQKCTLAKEEMNWSHKELKALGCPKMTFYCNFRYTMVRDLRTLGGGITTSPNSFNTYIEAYDKQAATYKFKSEIVDELIHGLSVSYYGFTAKPTNMEYFCNEL